MNGKRNYSLRIPSGIIAILSLTLGSLWAQAPVKLWEEPLVIPTYKIGEPDRNPIFYSGRAYQGAKGLIYPYPVLDKITDVREDKAYHAVYLENKFIKLCVLPEIGGRILMGLDKTDNYDFFYHQHVIKPALIGMLGAWISGGVEWDVPHHHRASTYITVDHVLQENPDGSKTVWVGETELRHRMKWIVGLTVFPDKSYVEATVKLFNRTPVAHSMLYFANVAVHANKDYQVIFPPDTQYATFHAKNEFLHWPISDRDFGGLEFGKPVDVSWWKNHPSPTSWFCWDCEEDFFGGYDHSKLAGVVQIADHNVVPGKKFFEWGSGSEAAMWDKILTDSDGPYLELMAGAYSDNQPDYSWVQPYEMKTFKQYWYPIRNLGGIKNANLDAAMNLEVKPDQTARVAFNTTSAFLNAKVVLRAGDKVLLEQTVDISPGKPFAKEVSLPADVEQGDLKASLYSAANRELISYTPVKMRNSPMPQAVKRPPAPKDIKTVEVLYLTGLRLEQFYSPALEPYPYYEEALRRDPGDSRVNTQLAILYCKRGMFKEAEQHLNKAIERTTKDYTRPKDGEAFYYLGVALAAQGKLDAAYDAFYRATWSNAWHAAAYYELARISSRRSECTQALEHLNRSIAYNTENTTALNLKTSILRKLGRTEEAERVASTVLAIDPLNFYAGNELYLAKQKLGASGDATGALDTLKGRMRNEPQSYLEMAVDYGNAGFYGEAIETLSRVDDGGAHVSPTVYYYLAYYSEMAGNKEAAEKYFRLASKMPRDYCFPFRWESKEVLEHAMQHNPQDARAPYYLGNLLYDHQPENAIRAWEKSRSLDPSYATVHRNLGLAYAQKEKNPPKAIASLEEAIECDRNDGRLFYELDQLYEQAGTAPAKRLTVLERNQEAVMQRDDAVQQEAILYVQLGQYEKAISLLSQRHFHVWEGGGDIHDVYIDAFLLRGQEKCKAKRYEEALKDFEKALEYPDNLEVGRPHQAPRDAEIYYSIGSAQEALGNDGAARTSFEKAVAVKLTQRHFDLGASSVRYFQGLALRNLNRETDATTVFEELIAQGQKELKASSMDFFAKFGGGRSGAAQVAEAHYLIGLGLLGEGKKAEAKAELQETLKSDVNHLGAITRLADFR
ncbi:MAG: DUF5107 domain-containing protein [Terriglobia bacterium]|jgi:tetratricopeptide (TPR) repeat protein